MCKSFFSEIQSANLLKTRPLSLFAIDPEHVVSHAFADVPCAEGVHALAPPKQLQCNHDAACGAARGTNASFIAMLHLAFVMVILALWPF